MHEVVVEHDSEVALSQLKRETLALEILKNRTSSVPFVLISGAGVGVCSLLVFSSGFTSPLVIHVFIIVGFLGAIMSSIDNFLIRRKLDAAVELILAQEKRRQDK